MKNVRILDTTLRDGGRLVSCCFPDEHISDIISGLTASNIDIIEVGFLRDGIEYKKNSTIFTSLEQLNRFIPNDNKNSEYVVFADYGKEYGMWDFSKITPCTGKGITGFRVGYRKKDLQDAIPIFKTIMGNGYKLFVQGVESLSYSEEELLRAIEIINKIGPHSFGIVDTYGAMYKDDVLNLYKLVDDNLDKNIAIDFHSHNNMQLSFSFAQEIIEASNGKRQIIIDSTLEGVGKGTGNLNTELIVDFLNRKYFYDYKTDNILDLIDEYIYPLKDKHNWSYSIPYYMAGIYSSHANNIIYLTEKHRVKTKDIKHIISMIEPEKRKRYDYENIEKIYIEYNSSNVDDEQVIEALKKDIDGSEVLILVPGKGIDVYKERIKDYCEKKSPCVISVNFDNYDVCDIDFAFYGNQRRYDKHLNNVPCIISSNIKDADEKFVVNYNKLINRDFKYFDNSTIMLLNLLKDLQVSDICIAGFDGFSDDSNQDFYHEGYPDYKTREEKIELNLEIEKLLIEYEKTVRDKINIAFITPSAFNKIFEAN